MCFRLWSGLYKFAYDYNYILTYPDGTRFDTTDINGELFPQTSGSNEQYNFRYTFPASFCPTLRYYQGNDMAIADRYDPPTNSLRSLPVVCKGIFFKVLKRIWKSVKNCDFGVNTVCFKVLVLCNPKISSLKKSYSIKVEIKTSKTVFKLIFFLCFL